MPDRESVIAAVTAYVARVHAGDWRAAFDAADTDGDGAIGSTELSDLLKRAGIGMALTRGTIVRAILAEVDANKDGSIDLKELLDAFIAQQGEGSQQ